MRSLQWPSAKLWAQIALFASTFGIGCVVGVTQFWGCNLVVTGGDWLQLLGMILVPVMYYLLVQRRHDSELTRTEHFERKQQIIRTLVDSEIRPCREGIIELMRLMIQKMSDGVVGQRHAEEVLKSCYLVSEHVVETKLLLDAYGIKEAVGHAIAINDILGKISEVANDIIQVEHGHPYNPNQFVALTHFKLEALLHLAAMDNCVQMSDPSTENTLIAVRREIQRVRAAKRIQKEHTEHFPADETSE